jgi:hypothetical protein
MEVVIIATSPSFANTINNGSALLGTAETDTQVPAQTQTIITAGASGTKIEEIVIEASKAASLVATTVAGLVYIFLYDGATYHLFDTITVSAVTASATAAPFRSVNRYPNLWLKNGWSLRASQSIAGNANLLKCHAFGADL